MGAVPELANQPFIWLRFGIGLYGREVCDRFIWDRFGIGLCLGLGHIIWDSGLGLGYSV